jgi:hypothetical protein
VVRIPNRLRPEEHSGPPWVSLVSVVEPSSRAEVTDLLAARVGFGKEFGRDRGQSTRGANGRSSNDHHPTAADISDDRIARIRKPQLDAGIEDLIRGCIPAKSQNEVARPASLRNDGRI